MNKKRDFYCEKCNIKDTCLSDPNNCIIYKHIVQEHIEKNYPDLHQKLNTERINQ